MKRSYILVVLFILLAVQAEAKSMNLIHLGEGNYTFRERKVQHSTVRTNPAYLR